jgi:outer membrane protein OmpA-like peptidoglycan-associated protein
MKVIATTVLCASLTLTGCANLTQDADGTTNKTNVYGGLGALAGALAGAAMSHDNRGKGALIGAAVGGLAGAGYGHYADKQEAQLRQATAGTGIEVQRQGDDIKLVMPGAITFATGQSALTPQAQWNLDKLVESFKAYGDNSIEVTGHTDSVGSVASNNDLSQARAIAVGKYLVAGGVDKSRIQVFGAGPSQPIASNSTEDGRAQNRRVEIKLKAPLQPVALGG